MNQSRARSANQSLKYSLVAPAAVEQQSVDHHLKSGEDPRELTIQYVSIMSLIQKEADQELCEDMDEGVQRSIPPVPFLVSNAVTPIPLAASMSDSTSKL